MCRSLVVGTRQLYDRCGARDSQVGVDGRQGLGDRWAWQERRRSYCGWSAGSFDRVALKAFQPASASNGGTVTTPSMKSSPAPMFAPLTAAVATLNVTAT